MPQKQKQPRPPRKPPSKRARNQWGGNGFRIAFARRMFAGGASYNEVRDGIVERWKVHRTTAEKDIAEAKRRNDEVTNKLIPELIARNSVRLDVIADLAEEAGKYNDAVAALREYHRIHGMYAPKKIQVSGQVVSVSLDIQAFVGVLDEDGVKALELVIAQIEAARARGEIAAAAPPASDDDDETSEHEPVTEN